MNNPTTIDHTQSEIQQPLSLTMLTGPSGSRCTKSFSKTTKGIVKNSTPMFGSGAAETININGIDELSNILKNLVTTQCISTGVFDQPKCQVVTKKELKDKPITSNYRSRSKQHMTQPENGLIMIDYDFNTEMPEPLRCDSVEDVMGKLVKAIPELASVGYVGSTSSSSGVYSPSTGEIYSGGGFHIYLAARGIDLDTFKKALEIKLWNAGYGYIGFARNGTILNRTIIDLAVLSPERLIYEASPVLGNDVRQHQRKWANKEGSVLYNNLTVSVAEEDEYRQRISDARQAPAAVENSRQIKEAYIENRVPIYAKKLQVSSDKAAKLIRDQIIRLDDQKEFVLKAEHMVYVDEQTQLSVSELIAQEKSYEGVYIPDPIEGPEYGLSKAMFSNYYRPQITSFAHGQITVYELCEFFLVSEEETKLMAPVTNKALTPPDIKKLIHPLKKFSLTGTSADLEQQLEESKFVLPDLALQGQATVIFAPPNTGKTLLTIGLLTKAIECESIDPKKLYYINADDNQLGLIQKLRIAEEYGFQMLAPGHNNFQAADFLPQLQSMMQDDTVDKTIIILDTLKKFTDPMSKTRTRMFGAVIREFVSLGGTVISLAHTNKNRGNDGKPVYAGVSDPVDDSDCVYIMDIFKVADNKKVVTFENFKNRGNVAREKAFEYSIEDNDSYDALLASIKEVDPTQLDSLRTSEDGNTTEDTVVNELINCIKEGNNTKMKLAEDVSKITGLSKRKVIGLIEKHTGDDPKIHKWQFKRGARGVQNFTLLEYLPSPPIPPDN